MSSETAVADWLADIIENAERIESYIAGLDRDAFEADGRTRDAVERCLERVCEAAYRLGDVAAELIPDQPWADIRGMGIAYATPTTGSASTSSGTRRRGGCPNWPPPPERRSAGSQGVTPGAQAPDRSERVALKAVAPKLIRRSAPSRTARETRGD